MRMRHTHTHHHREHDGLAVGNFLSIEYKSCCHHHHEHQNIRWTLEVNSSWALKKKPNAKKLKVLWSETTIKNKILKMKAFIVLSAVLAIAAAAPTAEESSSFRKSIANCLESDDTFSCLSVKGITALNRAARSASIELFPGVSLQRYNSIEYLWRAEQMFESEHFDCFPVRWCFSSSMKIQCHGQEEFWSLESATVQW